MLNILVGAMRLRVATETLHPLYRLYVPQGRTEGVSICPGIAVEAIPDLGFVTPTDRIILQAEVESLQ